MTHLFEGFTPSSALLLLACLAAAYAVGSIPWAYIIVRAVTGEDVTDHGTGNVGAMNVRRTTGSWAWFLVAMFSDLLKGTIFVAAVKVLALGTLVTPVAVVIAKGTAHPAWLVLLPMAAVAGVVFGHNYSVWMALIKRTFARTGKGLATGAGALLAYDWRYFVAVVVVGLATIAISRFMMAGQVAASWTLPAAAVALRAADWPFMLVMGAVVYAAHHRRFIGLLKGREPKFYIQDRGGPRG